MSALHSLLPSFGQRSLSVDLEPLVSAAMRGQYELLMAEIERAATRLFPMAMPKVILYTGGQWREWSTLEGEDTGLIEALPEVTVALRQTLRIGSKWFVPITPGAAALLLRAGDDDVEPDDALKVLLQCGALALQTCERQRLATQNLDEVLVMHRVVTRMLKSHDLGEILLYITQEAKRLLDADICGVLLCDGDRIVMRRCIGNRSPETASLVMVAGQGLAGRVLAQREPASVADYLASDEISRDFFPLAEAERVRSALAAPLNGRGALIGVLEVWRRRPSTFTSMDTTRLVALANMTSIAIENAELYAAQAAMVAALGEANAALNERYATVRSVSDLTQQLMHALLQGSDLSDIVKLASEFLACELGVVGVDGQLQVWRGGEGAGPAPQEVCCALRSTDRRGATRSDGDTLVLGTRCWRVQPVLVEGQPVAWVVGALPQGPAAQDDSLITLTLTQVAMMAALHRLEQRAASRARAESIDALVWELLRAEDSARLAALDRAQELRLDLSGPLRLFMCELGAVSLGMAECAGSALRQRVAAALPRTEHVRAIALQGGTIALLCADRGTEDSERFAHRTAQRLSEELAGRRVLVGASSHCAVPRALGVACREARIALDVCRQLDRTGAIVYDRAGVVGLLLSLRYEAGMRRFLELNLGVLLQEEERQREMYLQTLRVFFDTNCSHEAASHHLGVHRKTIAHRLTKISELTGLDLTTHDDRLVADLCLYVHRLLGQSDRADDPMATAGDKKGSA